MTALSESALETATLSWFASLGCEAVAGKPLSESGGWIDSACESIQPSIDSYPRSTPGRDLGRLPCSSPR